MYIPNQLLVIIINPNNALLRENPVNFPKKYVI